MDEWMEKNSHGADWEQWKLESTNRLRVFIKMAQLHIERGRSHPLNIEAMHAKPNTVKLKENPVRAREIKLEI